jgi:hypothetical protein
MMIVKAPILSLGELYNALDLFSLTLRLHGRPGLPYITLPLTPDIVTLLQHDDVSTLKGTGLIG